jgi:splicing factor 3B subunit 5
MHRDTAASFLGHPHLASYLAVAEGESLGRIRYRLLSKMVAPCGVPPKRADE